MVHFFFFFNLNDKSSWKNYIYIMSKIFTSNRAIRTYYCAARAIRRPKLQTHSVSVLSFWRWKKQNNKNGNNIFVWLRSEKKNNSIVFSVLVNQYYLCFMYMGICFFFLKPKILWRRSSGVGNVFGGGRRARERTKRAMISPRRRAKNGGNGNSSDTFRRTARAFFARRIIIRFNLFGGLNLTGTQRSANRLCRVG